jgi:hypothetical protein
MKAISMAHFTRSRLAIERQFAAAFTSDPEYEGAVDRERAVPRDCATSRRGTLSDRDCEVTIVKNTPA